METCGDCVYCYEIKMYDGVRRNNCKPHPRRDQVHGWYTDIERPADCKYFSREPYDLSVVGSMMGEIIRKTVTREKSEKTTEEPSPRKLDPSKFRVYEE